jgi:hypothetical protein
MPLRQPQTALSLVCLTVGPTQPVTLTPPRASLGKALHDQVLAWLQYFTAQPRHSPFVQVPEIC